MAELGRAFGELIYMLDASDDAEKDARSGEFNALRAAFGIADAAEPLPAEIYNQSAAILQAMGTRIERALFSLPLPEGRAEMFAARLHRNLSRRMGRTAPTACATQAPAPKTPLRERWNAAIKSARRICAVPPASPPPFSARLAAPFRFAAAFGIALIFPRQTQAANSLKDCRDIALNLIFIGEAVNGMARQFAFASALPVKTNFARMMSRELTHTEKRPGR